MGKPNRGVIVTADDFGADIAVNEAVEEAFRRGILTAASLMIGGDAAADAVQRAHRLPGLGIGLHVVLADGRPILPPGHIPGLAGPDGRFHHSMLRTALAVALSQGAREQMRSEIEAQFAAFAETGLRLDHVNTHKHFHLHPMIASAILEIGPRYGMRAMRVPFDPGSPLPMRWWSSLLGRRLRAAGMLVNDEVRGLSWSGGFDAARMHEALTALPKGLTELYCHPANAEAFPGSAPGYRYRDELAALVDSGNRQALVESGATAGCFGDFEVAGAGASRARTAGG